MGARFEALMESVLMYPWIPGTLKLYSILSLFKCEDEYSLKWWCMPPFSMPQASFDPLSTSAWLMSGHHERAISFHLIDVDAGSNESSLVGDPP